MIDQVCEALGLDDAALIDFRAVVCPHVVNIFSDLENISKRWKRLSHIALVQRQCPPVSRLIETVSEALELDDTRPSRPCRQRILRPRKYFQAR